MLFNQSLASSQLNVSDTNLLNQVGETGTELVLQVEATDNFFSFLIFSDCFSPVLYLARVSVTTGSMR